MWARPHIVQPCFRRRNFSLYVIHIKRPELSLSEHALAGEATWLPVIKQLYQLASDPSSAVHIQSAWVIERPNHGDAGLLNEKELKEHYSEICTRLSDGLLGTDR
jgi:hypothetical protein